MKVGAYFPLHALDPSPDTARRFATAVEEMGYSHVLLADHVVGASRQSRPDWQADIDVTTPFPDVFVLGAFMAACTTTLEFMTSVLILPQRQTALVAKQAAYLDVLSSGRLRLGVGTGWNPVEYEALGVDWSQRGAIMDEQIGLLRQLWTQEAVTYHGTFHHIDDAGINPLPVQRPIPLWFGQGREATPEIIERVSRRAARLGDGWMPNFPADEEGQKLIRNFHGYCQEYGRSQVPVQGFVSIGDTGPSEWQSQLDLWGELGATLVGLTTSTGEFKSIDGHLARMEEASKVLMP